jgi:hypothetical protein
MSRRPAAASRRWDCADMGVMLALYSWELEATTGFEPVNRGFADLPLNHLGTSPRAMTAVQILRCGWPSRIRTSVNGSKVRCPTTRRRASGPRGCVSQEGSGAEDGTRTRDPHLGKVMLYQLSHFRSWCREPESNWRHRDFQSRALPTELSRRVQNQTGRPATGSIEPYRPGAVQRADCHQPATVRAAGWASSSPAAEVTARELPAWGRASVGALAKRWVSAGAWAER